MNYIKRFFFFHNIPEDNLLSTYYVSDTFLLGPGDTAVNKSHCHSKEQWGNQTKSPLPLPKNAQVHWLRVYKPLKGPNEGIRWNTAVWIETVNNFNNWITHLFASQMVSNYLLSIKLNKDLLELSVDGHEYKFWWLPCDFWHIWKEMF